MTLPADALPIDAHLGGIVASLKAHGAVVIVAEPGAGKTTRVPPALVDAGFGGARGVILLQPRRVAARAAARRISAERGDEPGGFAGWQIRFETCVSARTRIRVVTEGILTRMIHDDPGLDGVGAVILDEFHERTLHGDMALALLREVQADLRPDLKIVVMSATLDAAPVAAFLGDAPVVRVPGRVFPIAVEYATEHDTRQLHLVAAAGVARAVAAGPGGILVFLPGVGEINRTAEALGDLAAREKLTVLPLHGDLPATEQDRIFGPTAGRAVILATNIAETSLTVPGVTTVVDTGMARVLTHDADHGTDRLELRRISRASATQRAGRAGRTGPGRVFRLWTRAEENAMPEFDTPEIRRVDLAGTVLDLAVWGVRDAAAFGWYEAPEPAALAAARELLVALAFIDPATGAPTNTGRRLARLPVHPRVARLLADAHDAGFVGGGAGVAALLSERDPLFREGAKRLPTGPSDVLARLDLLADADRGRWSPDVDRNGIRQIQRVRDRLADLTVRILGRAPHPAPGADAETELLRALFAAFPDRLARRRVVGGADAVMIGGRGVVVAPESVVRDAEFFVAVDADMGRRGMHARTMVRQASAVERAWIDDVAVTSRETTFDPATGRVVGRVVRRFGDLVIESGETGAPDLDAAAALLLEYALREPELALDFASVAPVLARWQCVSAWMPDLGVPALDPAALAAAAAPWIHGKTSLAETRRIPLADVIASVVPRALAQQFEGLAPADLPLPSGRSRRLEYAVGKAPVLAVRLQELFGLADTPRVAGGRVEVLLHLLAPNQQVVQVTHDLRSFWNTTYQQVRKDLRGRYPRHSWPEDPWTAEPTARAKRRGT